MIESCTDWAALLARGLDISKWWRAMAQWFCFRLENGSGGNSDYLWEFSKVISS